MIVIMKVEGISFSVFLVKQFSRAYGCISTETNKQIMKRKYILGWLINDILTNYLSNEKLLLQNIPANFRSGSVSRSQLDLAFPARPDPAPTYQEG